MKYLKIIGGLLLLLIIIFIAIGFIKPTVAYENEITVDKPLEEAWMVMSDESKLDQWIKGYQKTELISGTPNTVGAVSNIHVEENGREIVMQETITSIKDNDHIAMNFSTEFMDMDYRLTVKKNGNKTDIHTETKVKGNHLISRSIIALMPGTFKAEEDKNLQRLKETIESNKKIYSVSEI